MHVPSNQRNLTASSAPSSKPKARANRPVDRQPGSGAQRLPSAGVPGRRMARHSSRGGVADPDMSDIRKPVTPQAHSSSFSLWYPHEDLRRPRGESSCAALYKASEGACEEISSLPQFARLPTTSTAKSAAFAMSSEKIGKSKLNRTEGVQRMLASEPSAATAPFTPPARSQSRVGVSRPALTSSQTASMTRHCNNTVLDNRAKTTSKVSRSANSQGLPPSSDNTSPLPHFSAKRKATKMGDIPTPFSASRAHPPGGGGANRIPSHNASSISSPPLGTLMSNKQTSPIGTEPLPIARHRDVEPEIAKAKVASPVERYNTPVLTDKQRAMSDFPGRVQSFAVSSSADRQQAGQGPASARKKETCRYRSMATASHTRNTVQAASTVAKCNEVNSTSGAKPVIGPYSTQRAISPVSTPTKTTVRKSTADASELDTNTPTLGQRSKTVRSKEYQRLTRHSAATGVRGTPPYRRGSSSSQAIPLPVKPSTEVKSSSQQRQSDRLSDGCSIIADAQRRNSNVKNKVLDGIRDIKTLKKGVAISRFQEVRVVEVEIEAQNGQPHCPSCVCPQLSPCSLSSPRSGNGLPAGWVKMAKNPFEAAQEAKTSFARSADASFRSLERTQTMSDLSGRPRYSQQAKTGIDIANEPLQISPRRRLKSMFPRLGSKITRDLLFAMNNSTEAVAILAAEGEKSESDYSSDSSRISHGSADLLVLRSREPSYMHFKETNDTTGPISIEESTVGSEGKSANAAASDSTTESVAPLTPPENIHQVTEEHLSTAGNLTADSKVLRFEGTCLVEGDIKSEIASKEKSQALESKSDLRTFSRQSFIVAHSGPLSMYYDVADDILGSGTYGSVRKGTHKVTNCVRAIKIVDKSKVTDEKRFRQEIHLMKKLDHPNIVKLYETYEDTKHVYLALELCSGGELFDFIIQAGRFSEDMASHLMHQIFSAIYYLHENQQIVHRDIKPENFLFLDESKNSSLKVIDFGLATPFKEGQSLSTKAGTPYYVSPEVLNGSYTNKCDVWSCGVIMYILLCGYPPFYGECDREILQKVKEAKVIFADSDWGGVSAEARDLIKQMLIPDQNERITVAQTLAHPWFRRKSVEVSDDLYASWKGLTPSIFENFKAFREKSKLKKAAITFVARQLGEDRVKKLRQCFTSLDANGDGSLSPEEMIQGIILSGITDLPPDAEKIIRDMDSDGSGLIDYTEFLAAALDSQYYSQEDACWQAFHLFDLDGDGKISRSELTQVLHSNIDGSNPLAALDVERLIQGVDKNGDGLVDFAEFWDMMRHDN